MVTYNIILENGRWHSYYSMPELEWIKQLEEWHNTKLKKVLKITNAYTPKAEIEEIKAENVCEFIKNESKIES